MVATRQILLSAYRLTTASDLRVPLATALPRQGDARRRTRPP